MNRLASLAALVLPIVGLGGLWGWTHSWTSQGTDWDVPVRGYDPRDLLRGHYIQFTYDWPGDEAPDGDAWMEDFCIEGTAPKVDRIVYREDVEACAHFAKAAPGSVYGTQGLRRGRLYVPQAQARTLEEKLLDPKLRGIVTVRQRVDGRILPQSIRFQELTDAERADRETINPEREMP